LGSSSTVTVAVIKAVSSLLGLGLSKPKIAEMACFIEIDKLGMPIGKQDQFAAAFGGLNAIAFSDEGAAVEPLALRSVTFERLERELLLFYTGTSREAGRVLTDQNRAIREGNPAVISSLHAIKAMAMEARRCLHAGDLQRLGELLHESWEQKKRLASGISNPQIDEYYETALAHGAVGGKITGAGGGGFLMLYCGRHAARVTEALERAGLKRMDYSIDFDGAKILVNNAIPFEVARDA
jgi:D-glycero-alpha-D-manno-heptose-7-phosphate kinase